MGASSVLSRVSARAAGVGLACALAFAAGTGAAFGATVPVTAGPTWGIDDFNTSTIHPEPAVRVSALPDAECPWISSTLTDFVRSHAGWSYDWAPQEEMTKVEEGLTILDYFAWVVHEPDVRIATGQVYVRDQGLNDPEDVGGAVFNLDYEAVAGAHVFADLHWIQAYHGSAYGGAVVTRLDNGGASTPFYDTRGAAGRYGPQDEKAWFLDRPWTKELEYEGNPVADYEYQVVLADYDSAAMKITLYGGYWWGYTYTASDVPLPPAVFVTGWLVALLIFFRRRVAAAIGLPVRARADFPEAGGPLQNSSSTSRWNATRSGSRPPLP